jgi:hypothetical protein
MTMPIPHLRAVSAFFAATLACAASAQAVNLKGRVLDKATLSGVPGATVKVAGSNLAVTTDSAGRFTLSGSVALGAGRQAAREPRFKDGALLLDAASAGEARIELFGAQGESLSSAVHPVKPGVNRVDAFRGAPRDFAGFARIRVDGHTWIKRALRTSGPAPAAWIGGPEGAPASLYKSAAGGNVEVSVTGLLPKTVAYSADDQDLGDIVLDYPARKLGVGAAPVYGATVLFDGSKGRAAANAQLQDNWKDWPRFSPSDIKFRIVRDPQYLNDTNRVALQSCCNTQWGYDDIQAKIGLFEDCQIHVEWIGMGEYDNPYDTIAPNANASDPAASGQKGYINSGVYVASRYEVQIQSWDTAAAKVPGAHDMGAIVNDYTPTSNQNRGNGVWQAYDITYRGARWNGTTMTSQPYMSVWWNGVLVHDNRKVNAAASGLSNHSGEEHNDPAVYGLKLQSEGRDVRYRNVWIKKLVLNDAQTKLGY